MHQVAILSKVTYDCKVDNVLRHKFLTTVTLPFEIQPKTVVGVAAKADQVLISDYFISSGSKAANARPEMYYIECQYAK